MAPLPPSAQIVRDRGDRGRVVHYTREDGRPVYAKLYPTAAESHRCVEVLTGLREVGFTSGTPHRVPAVLEHRPEDRVVVLAAAQGRSLASLVREAPDPGLWRHGVQGAARWLGALHAAPTWVCRTVDVARLPLVRLQARHAAVVAARPEVTVETTALLEALADRAPPHTRVVDRTTHGRFHPEHVFLDPAAEVVTGIDLDRASPTDPVRDVGEFVHRLRSLVARSPAAGTTGNALTAEFLAQYRRSSGGAALTSLAYHWSFAILWHLFGSMAKGRSRSSLDRHRAEFAAVPRLVSDLT